MGITDDPNHPGLGHGTTDTPGPQNATYLVLAAELRAGGFVRPVITAYIHALDLGGCGAVTHMGLAIAETYAKRPRFYGATYCAGCGKHRPVGERGEFEWISMEPATWTPDGPLEPSPNTVTFNRLKVGT